MSKRFSYYGSRASFANTKSVFFDGIDADLRFADGIFNSMTDGSISMWIRQSSLSIVRVLFGCTINDSSNEVTFGVRDTGALYVFGRTANVNQYYAETATGLISTGVWYHLVWTKTGTTHKAYINAVDTTLNFSISTNLDKYFDDVIGTRRYTLGSYRRLSTTNRYVGYMDEFVISPTAWSQAQVTALYNNGCPGNLALHSDYANMITWLRMGEGDTYPTIQDNIGANDATMTNMIAADITSTTPC